MKNHQNFSRSILLIISLIAVGLIFIIGPIKQDLNYHRFADQRSFFSIQNFTNVVTNIPFVIIGILGVLKTLRKYRKVIDYQLVALINVFFLGVFLTGIGSVYYHLNPTNETLFWDRLPMTISFMAFFSIVVGEFISVKLGYRFFIPLLICGVLSLLYWQVTENSGAGDLRFYVLIQFLPIVLITAILILYKNNNGNVLYYLVLSIYLLAKLFELNDEFIFSTNLIISGHSIKHIIAAAAPLVFLIGLSKRKPASIIKPLSI
ncbi:MAG: ceramidase domain-containing protein [Burkholderiales bacterium]|nr:ceramidase domain-containing protein [Bacteroidia bacterium]